MSNELDEINVIIQKIMSKKCTHCGSYNTELKVSGNVGYAFAQGARIVAGGAALVAGLFNHSAGHVAGHGVLKNTEDWGKDINRHHCCACGKDFI